MHTPKPSTRLAAPNARGASRAAARAVFVAACVAGSLAAVALAGCDKPADNSNRSAGQVLDGAIAQTSKKADEIKDSAAKGLEKIEDKAKDIAQDVKQGSQSAADSAGTAVSDAVISTEVNSGLSKDAKLSALRINVDTVGGRVALTGTAPDEASRARATQLALMVKGVVSVDNRLVLAADKM
jgi:hyperosmotically inducible periplasmic protein